MSHTATAAHATMGRAVGVCSGAHQYPDDDRAQQPQRAADRLFAAAGPAFALFERPEHEAEEGLDHREGEQDMDAARTTAGARVDMVAAPC